MAMFKEAADIKTSDQLNLPVPQAKFETVVVKPSEIQQDMVQALSERAAEVHSGSVDPSVDNMLKITSDGRKIGLDQRLMNSALPDDPNSKLRAYPQINKSDIIVPKAGDNNDREEKLSIMDHIR